jgi:hypothetical protein
MDSSELRAYFTSFERPASPFQTVEPYQNRHLELVVDLKEEPGNPRGIRGVKIVDTSPTELTFQYIDTGKTGVLKSDLHEILEVRSHEANIPVLLTSAANASAFMKRNGLTERPDYVLGTSSAAEFCNEHFYRDLPLSVDFTYIPERRARDTATPPAKERTLTGVFISAEFSDILQKDCLFLQDAENRFHCIPLQNITSAAPIQTGSEYQVIFENKKA